MSEIKVNKISPKTACGTTTLGDSGDTFTIPAGVTITNNGTQTGFGRTGTVDWQTSIKTVDFTAVSGEGYFVNTTSGAITATLPSSPSAGAIVAFKDYAQNFNTNSLTLNRNGSNIEGLGSNQSIDGISESVTFVYADSTKGWVLVNESTTRYGPQYVAATGGNTVATCGDFKIHTFTSPGTFTVTNSGNPAGSDAIDYLVVAGGGGSPSLIEAVGGGGGGGVRESQNSSHAPVYTASPLKTTTSLNLPATGYPITVGAGGSGGTANPGCSQPYPLGSQGSSSVFSTITSSGGGHGGTFKLAGGAGGSGGGGGGRTNASGGAGNTPPVSPPQGNSGGTSNPPDSGPEDSSGGGGGATAAGGDGTPSSGGAGGAGATTNINGSPTTFGGGGGGGSQVTTAGSGGSGGGGQGGSSSGSRVAAAGTANTGGGAGGKGNPPGSNGAAGLAGGSGIVIIRYKFQ